MSGREYVAYRMRMIEGWQKAGINPYPHKFHVTVSLPAFLDKYAHLEAGAESEDIVGVAGRCMGIRESSKKVRADQITLGPRNFSSGRSGVYGGDVVCC